MTVSQLAPRVSDLPRTRWAYLGAAAIVFVAACKSPVPADASTADEPDNKLAPAAASTKTATKTASKTVPGEHRAKPPRKSKRPHPPITPLPDGPIATIAGTALPGDEFRKLLEMRLAMVQASREDGQVPEGWQRHYRMELAQRLVWEQLLAREIEATGTRHDTAALAAHQPDQNYGDRANYLARMMETEASLAAKNLAFYHEMALLGETEPTPAEIQTAYERALPKLVADVDRVRTAHIMVMYGPRSRDASGNWPRMIEPTAAELEAADPTTLAAWKQAALLRAQALGAQASSPGVDFMALARRTSEGPGASRGGDMGVFDAQRMVGEYSQAAFKLEVGAISEAIASERGFYIIKLLGRYPAGTALPLDAVADEFRRTIKAEKTRHAREQLQRRLYAKFATVNHVLPTIGEPAVRVFRATENAAATPRTRDQI